MMARRRAPKPGSFLSLDELHPTIEVAGCWRFDTDTWHRYRLPSHHLILLESGRIDAATPAETFTAKAGDLICFRPATQNEFSTVGPTLFFQVLVSFAPPPRHQATPWLDEAGPLPVRLTLGNALPEVRRLFEQICADLHRSGVAQRLRLQSEIYTLLALIAGQIRGDLSPSLQLDPWQRARLRVAAGVGASPNIAALAREMGVSREHFIRQFRHRFGITPKAFHTQNRLREACRLLRLPEQPIKQIAYELGFGNPKSLTRAIRRHLGVNASDLRLAKQPAGALEQLQPPADVAYPVNQHIVPTGTPLDWQAKFAVSYRIAPQPRRHRSRGGQR